MALEGYLITFSTYGARLPGDERGTFRPDGSFCPPSAALLAYADALRTFDCVTLDAARRRVVRDAIVGVAQHRGWDLTAVHVRTQHAHVVVRSPLHRPERVMNDFKAYSTRALREARLHPTDARVWAGHGSTVWLWNQRQVREATDYVFDRQGEPMERYPDASSPRR